MKIFPLALKEETVIPSVPPAILDLRATDPYFSEILKGFRAKVEYKMDNMNLRLLAVSSAIAGEGKTLTSIQLASNMASTGRKKVLLLDMDLRKSGVAPELGMTSYSGLSEFLMGYAPKEKIIWNSTVPGLSIIPAGKTISSPADMLAGEKFRTLLRELREQFDLVVLDTPPILPVPDAVTISEQVDAFILLFRFSHTPHKLFHKAIEELGERKILGVVLNGEEKKPDKYYQKYYGKYYHAVNKE